MGEECWVFYNFAGGGVVKDGEEVELSGVEYRGRTQRKDLAKRTYVPAA